MTLRFHPVHLSTIHVHFFWHLHVTSTSQIKLHKLCFYDAWWPPTHIPRGPRKELYSGLLSTSDSWAGMNRTPDGGFYKGLPFILGCKQPEQLYYKWVIYSLLHKPSSVGSFMNIVTKSYQCAWCLWFVWALQTREKSCCLEHLHVGFCISCKWVPASNLPQMSYWPLIFFFCSLLQLLATVRPGCWALHFNYSSYEKEFPLCALFSSSPNLRACGLLLPLPTPQVPCMSEGLFTRVLIPFKPLICILCSANEGTWRSQMAYLFPQETRYNLVGHLPNWRQGEMPLFQEGLVQMPLSLRGQHWVPLGYILFHSTSTLWRVLFCFCQKQHFWRY